MFFLNSSFQLACILVLQTSDSYNYELALYILMISNKKKYHFPPQFFCVFTTVRQSTLGSLNKPRRWRQRGYGKTKDLIGTKIVQHVHFIALYFLSRPLQNNNVKSPQFASSANRNRDGKLFLFPFGTQRFFNTLCWCWGVAP